jgi:integrase
VLTACNRAGTCLIIRSVHQLKPQLSLTLAGGFIGLQTCIDELIAAKRAANRRPRYVDSLEHYLRQFSTGQELKNLCDLTFLDLENWLAKYGNASTKITWVSRFSALFSFAVRRGYVTANPCDRLEKISVDRKPPFILPPAQSKRILAATPTVLIPYLVLGMFAGIRPEEIMRMKWSDVDLETKTARVDGKTRQRRIVPLPEIAVHAKHPLHTGLVAPSASSVTRWKHRVRAMLGFCNDFFSHNVIILHFSGSFCLI